MRRRRFLGSIAAAACAPVAAQGERPRIVIVHPASVEDSAIYRHLVAGLRSKGYVDGTTVTLELRSGKGVTSTLPGIVRQAIAERPRVVVVVGPAAVRAAAEATATVPIVAIDLESDPVANGWMRTLSRPGTNVTGLFLDLTGMSIKWLQLLRQAVPNVRDVAFLWDASSAQTQLGAIRDAARKVGLSTRTIAVDDWTKFESIMTAGVQPIPPALVVLSSPVAYQYSEQLASFTKLHRMPGISPFRRFPVAGGLMSYGPDLEPFFARAPVMVDRILRGASPADIAVEQPVKYELVVNNVAAGELGLTLPQNLLVLADEVRR